MSQTLLLVLGVLGGELLLLLLGLLTFSWWRHRAARQRDAQAIEALVSRVKKAKGEREAVIGSFLAGRLGMSGEALRQGQVALLRAELRLLQRLATVYQRRDAEAAAYLDRDLYAALEPYYGLQPEHLVAAAEAGGGECDALRAENQRLTEELRVIMQNISRMVGHYADPSATTVPPVETSASDRVGGGPAEGQPTPMPEAESGPPAAAPPEVAAHAAASVEARSAPSATGGPAGDVGDLPSDVMPAACPERAAPTQDTDLRLEEGPIEVVGYDEVDAETPGGPAAKQHAGV